MNSAWKLLLTRKFKLVVPEEDIEQDEAGYQMALAFNANISGMGFMFEKDVVDALAHSSRNSCIKLYHWLMPVLSEMVGGNRNHRSFYPNFPQQVMDSSIIELYFNAIVHYATLGDWHPEYRKIDRLPLPQADKKIRLITLGDFSDIEKEVENIVTSTTSISEGDKNDLVIFAMENPDWFDDIIRHLDKIHHKEILVHVTKILIGTGSNVDMSRHYRTATDVLRLAVALSDGDISLQKNTRFISFPRKTRRYLLNLIDKLHSHLVVEDMASRVGVWKRLGERLHPGDFQNEFPYAFAAFRSVRNNILRTYYGRLESALNSSLAYGLKVLSERPGIFARRLDELIRKNIDDYRDILLSFEKVASKVSTPVLLSAFGHFYGRNQVQLRTFISKGGKSKVVPNYLYPLPQHVSDWTLETLEDCLIERFYELEGLGRVRIDPALFKIVAPFSQRSASSGLYALTKGSRISFEPSDSLHRTQFIRPFIHWTNIEDENGYERLTDMDLSAEIYGENWENRGRVWYGNLKYGGRRSDYSAVHSGDFRSAPVEDGGASEYIDLNIDDLLRGGCRYVVLTVHSFSSQPFYESNVIFGWMNRTSAQKGEIFEPSTVQNKINLTSDSTVSVCAILDLRERDVIWVDTPLSRHYFSPNNVVESSGESCLMSQGIMELYKTKLSLGQLFLIHARARGEDFLVSSDSSDDENFDTVFGLYDGDILAGDIAQISSQFMS